MPAPLAAFLWEEPLGVHAGQEVTAAHCVSPHGTRYTDSVDFGSRVDLSQRGNFVAIERQPRHVGCVELESGAEGKQTFRNDSRHEAAECEPCTADTFCLEGSALLALERWRSRRTRWRKRG